MMAEDKKFKMEYTGKVQVYLQRGSQGIDTVLSMHSYKCPKCGNTIYSEKPLALHELYCQNQNGYFEHTNG